VGLLWLRFFEKKELGDVHVITVADYTVEISHLPKNIPLDENELKDHIADVTGHKVVDVQVAYTSRSQIHKLQYRGTLVKEQAHIVKEYRHYFSQNTASEITIPYLNSVQEKLNKLDIQIKSIDTNMRKNNSNPVICIAFNNNLIFF